MSQLTWHGSRNQLALSRIFGWTRKSDSFQERTSPFHPKNILWKDFRNFFGRQFCFMLDGEFEGDRFQELEINLGIYLLPNVQTRVYLLLEQFWKLPRITNRRSKIRPGRLQIFCRNLPGFFCTMPWRFCLPSTVGRELPRWVQAHLSLKKW